MPKIATTKMITITATASSVSHPLMGNRVRVSGSGADSPDVVPESGGVDPGATPPPGSRSGVREGSGS